MNEFAEVVRTRGMRVCGTINCDRMTLNEIYCERCTEEITGDMATWKDGYVVAVIVAMLGFLGGLVSGWFGGCQVSAHTPGPWRRTKGVLGVQGPKGKLILCIDDFGLTKDECVANANLIVAAPDLLAWLKSTFAKQGCDCNIHVQMGWPVPCQTCQIGALIAKAEGGAA